METQIFTFKQILKSILNQICYVVSWWEIMVKVTAHKNLKPTSFWKCDIYLRHTHGYGHLVNARCWTVENTLVFSLCQNLDIDASIIPFSKCNVYLHQAHMGLVFWVSKLIFRNTVGPLLSLQKYLSKMKLW